MKSYIKNILNMDNLTSVLEQFFFNKALPVIFKGIEIVLGCTLLYSFFLMIKKAIEEATTL